MVHLSAGTHWLSDTVLLLLLYTTMMYAMVYVLQGILATVQVRDQIEPYSMPEIVDRRKIGA